jgi:hypothetical protein
MKYEDFWAYLTEKLSPLRLPSLQGKLSTLIRLICFSYFFSNFFLLGIFSLVLYDFMCCIFPPVFACHSLFAAGKHSKDLNLTELSSSPLNIMTCGLGKE